MKIINWIKENKIITAIITGVLVEVIPSSIISRVNTLDFINATKIFWNEIIDFLYKILNFKVPVWAIILVLILFYIILLVIIKIEERKENNRVWYENYTEDNYRGVLYNWNYYKNFQESIDLKDFRPVCNCCKGNLTFINKHKSTYYSTPQFYCPNCDLVLKTPSSEEYEQAELFVRNNLKKKYEFEMKNKKK